MQYQTLVVQLPLVREYKKDRKMSTPTSVALTCADMRELSQESFQILLLDTKNRIMDRVMISLGILDASIVHPREVFRPACIAGCGAIICVHNHPSGDTTPSAEDVKITTQLIEAGKILGIRVLDHVIIGDGHHSMRESGVAKFE
jgi:DNA repair protein RadC